MANISNTSDLLASLCAQERDGDTSSVEHWTIASLKHMLANSVHSLGEALGD